MAYVESNGESYSADDAMALASGYYGDKFNKNSYAFSGNYYDYKNYVADHITNEEDYCNADILVFDPDKISGWEGNGSGIMHAVIVEDYDPVSGSYSVFDPSSGERGNIDVTELNTSGRGFKISIK